MACELRFPSQGAREAGRRASSLVEVFHARAIAQPDQTAFTFLVDGQLQSQHLTYEQLDRRARALAVRLRGTCEPGGRALLMYDAGLDYLVALAGCLYAGVVAVPVFPPDPLRAARTLPRLQTVLQDADPTLILGSGANLAWVGPLLGDAWRGERLLATDALDESLAIDWTYPPIDREALALLQYTSGSTGNPKGVMLRHGNVLHNLDQIETASRDDAVVVTWLPAYHDMGLIGGLLQCWYSGRHNVLLSPLMFFQRPLRWLEAVARFGATTTGAPDFAYDLCVRKSTPEERELLDLSRWQVALSGAEPVRAETIERFVSAFAPSGVRREIFCPCYGLAEATLMVSCTATHTGATVTTFDAAALAHRRAIACDPNHAPARVLVSSGRDSVNQRVLVVDPQSREPLVEGMVGEIWTSGPNLAAGYWNRPEATAATFQAYTADGQGPFLRTGDLGFFHRGELYPSGRLKDMLIVHGRNYYPQDIEQSIEGCHPAIKPYACAVLGVEQSGGEKVVVIQEVVRPKHHDLDEAARQVRNAVQAAHELAVDQIVFIKQGTIPKTTSGKIQRHACRDQHLQGQLRVVHIWPARTRPTATYVAPRTATEAALADAWAAVLGLERVGLHDNFFDLGGTSLLVTQLISRLSRHWHIELPLEELFEQPTIAQLAALIDERIAQQAQSECDFLALLDSMSDEEAAQLLHKHPSVQPAALSVTRPRGVNLDVSPELDSHVHTRMNGHVDAHSR